MSNDPRDWEFFEFARAPLPPKRPTDLSPSSSSDEETITSGDGVSDYDEDDPERIDDDVFTRLQRQLSSLQVRTTTNNNYDSGGGKRGATTIPVVPRKYLLDDSGRRWSVKPTSSSSSTNPPDESSLIVPTPKHQDGRSKLQQQSKSSAIRQTPLSLWQNFVPDRFLETHVIGWFNNRRSIGQDQSTTSSAKEKGKKTTALVVKKDDREKSHSTTTRSPPIDLDELKAFVAILYARAANTGDSSTTGFENVWTSDSFTPSFFIGAMEKTTFLNLLQDFLCIGSTDQASATPMAAPLYDQRASTALINEFNYRLLQSYDPGDTLMISDRSLSVNMRLPQSPFLSPGGGERIVTRRTTISWLRDARSGFFVKVAPPVYGHVQNDMIIDMIQLRQADTSRSIVMDETVKALLGASPIAGSGRVVYVGPTHAGVDCASDVFEKHKLHLVGQLPSSGVTDCRVPFAAKSRSVLKRSIGSSLFLFDYPLTLVSYQRRASTVRAPKIFVSTAHFSKNKADIDITRAKDEKQPPPAIIVDYQRFFHGLSEPTAGFQSLMVNKPENASDIPLDRVLFLDCLYAAAYNAFVLWKLEHQPTKKHDSIVVDFQSFLKRLACHLVKPYVSKRLASPEATTDDGRKVWQAAARQILRDADQMGESSSSGGGTGDTGGGGSDGLVATGSSGHPSTAASDDTTPSKKQQRNQTKKQRGGKARK